MVESNCCLRPCPNAARCSGFLKVHALLKAQQKQSHWQKLFPWHFSQSGEIRFWSVTTLRHSCASCEMQVTLTMGPVCLLGVCLLVGIYCDFRVITHLTSGWIQHSESEQSKKINNVLLNTVLWYFSVSIFSYTANVCCCPHLKESRTSSVHTKCLIFLETYLFICRNSCGGGRGRAGHFDKRPPPGFSLQNQRASSEDGGGTCREGAGCSQ